VAYSRRSSRSPRSRFTFGLLLLTALTILVLDLPGTGPLDPVRDGLAAVFRPVRAAGNAVFEPLSNGWKGAFGYDDVTDENDQLKKQLEQRKGDEAELARLEAENKELKKLNRIDTGGERSRAAEVVSGPLSSFDQSVEINLGSSNGVRKGMAVVTGGGVLGRIADTHRSTSTVELITESDVSIGVSVGDGDLAVAHGQGLGKPLRIEGIEDETAVEKGDYVYTSGIDRSAFPKDLVIGKVSKVGKASDGIARTIEVEPSADLTSRYVKVILREAPR